MRIAILLILLSFSAKAEVDCVKHATFCQIKKNAPSIDNKYAMRISNIIHKMHKKYHIPKNIFAAILRQESGYSLEARGCHWGIPVGETKAVQTCADFGIAQINWKTAEGYGLDLEKLTEDLEYSIEAGAIVLAGFKKSYGKDDPDYWTRYNCGAIGKTDRDTCQIYKKLVERYL